MASISKRSWTGPKGEARSAYQLRYKTFDGKIKRAQFNRRKDAEEFRRKVEPMEPKVAHRRECYTTAKTIEDATKEYLEALKIGVNGKPPLEESTLQTYFNRANSRIIPMFGQIRINELNTPYCETLRDQLVAALPNRRYAGQMWGFFKSIVKYMVSRGALSQNPCAPVTVYYASNAVSDDEDDDSRVNMPSPSEARQIMAYIRNKRCEGTKQERRSWHKWEAMIVLGFETGLRIGEILALPWSCVDLEKKTIRVKQTAKIHIHKIGKPKTKRAYRSVGISEVLATMLRDWKAHCPAGKEGLVFPARNGRLMDYNVFRQNAWNPMMRELGFAEPGRWKRVWYTPHSMRHFKASVALNSGANPFRLSRELGHSSIKTTQDLYGHLIPFDTDDLSENAVRVSALIS